MIGCSPASSATVRSMVVLPEPAWPCTPTVRWGESRIVRAASRWPGLRPASLQPGLDRGFRRQPMPGVQARAHAGDEVALGGARPVGDEGQVRPSRLRLDQVPVAPQLGDPGVQRFERMTSAPVRQRPGAQVVGGEHGAPLLQVLHGAAHHRQR